MPWNSKAEDEHRVASRRQEVAKLYCQGVTQWELARKFKVSQVMIHKDLQVIHKQWIETSNKLFDERKAWELAKIDNLERECWEAWYKSRQDAEKYMEESEEAVRKLRTRKKDGTVTEEVKLVPTRVVKKQERRGQTGDPRFLDQIAWCIETRVKMLGLIRDTTVNFNFNWDALAKQMTEPVEDTVEARILENIPTGDYEHVNGSANGAPENPPTGEAG